MLYLGVVGPGGIWAIGPRALPETGLLYCVVSADSLPETDTASDLGSQSYHAAVPV